MDGERGAKLCGDIYVPDQELPARAEDDRYITPLFECEQAYAKLLHWCPAWQQHRPCRSSAGNRHSPSILDPGAGPGIWGTVARGIWPNALIHGIDIQEQPKPEAYDRYEIGRFPGDWSTTGYDMVVGNPPFNQANTFVEESMRRLRPGGWLMFLLRLQYCTGSWRRDNLYHNYPLFLYGVYSRRISWRADGKRKTPPRDHALFIWQKGYQGSSFLDLIGKPGDKTLEETLLERNAVNPFTGLAASDILTPEHIL
jgi:hypothetical protein